MNKKLQDYNIDDIRMMNEQDAKENALETMEIKGFTVYFIDFEGYFGYSYLIYKNNHHIHYADDYELHHRRFDGNKKELKDYYIKGINRKLFTDAEIAAPVADYDEYTRKEYFLINYYCMQEDYVSNFFIGTESERQKLRDEVKDMEYNSVSFCWMPNKDFVKHHRELMQALKKAKDAMKNNYDYWEKAFIKEMYNHEYCYNWEGDYDVLSVFGPIEYTSDDDDIELYFNQLNFTDVQRDAYYKARQKYNKEVEKYL